MVLRCWATGLLCLVMVSIMGVASQEMPACAQSCINFYTGCDTGDVACDCTVEHLTAMQNATFGTCIVDGCGPDVALASVVPAILSLCPTASPTGGVSFVIVPTGSSSPVITASNKGQTTTSAPQTFKTASTTTSKPNFVTIPPSAQSSYGGDSAQKSGLKPGAIAGIAIGGLALLVGVLLAIFLIMRRRKRRAGGSARKEANIPRGAELDSRPIEELDGRTIEKTELAATEAVVRVRESPPLSPPVELDGAGMMSSPSELSGNEGTMRSQYGAGGVIPRKQIPQTRAPPVEVISAQGNESPEELERLAEEERRLDAEIAEAERIRDLRNQRASVQERIARAKGGT